MVDDIKPIHNGRAYFEFVPTGRKQDYPTLTVHRTADSVQTFGLPSLNEGLSLAASLVSQDLNEYKDGFVSVMLRTNGAFVSETNVHVQITNKDQVVYQQRIEMQPQSERVVDIPIDEVHKSYANGGVLILKITDQVSQASDDPNEVNQKRTINLERLVFIKPKNTIDFDVFTDKEEYSPGDQVDIEVAIPSSEDSTSQFYASVMVTDTSSFLKVPKFKQAPSVPAMIYLEKEVKQQDGAVNEFQHAQEYLDSTFDPTVQFKQASDEDLNLDLLLAVQDWRRWKFDDRGQLETEINNLKDLSADRLRLEYLRGQKNR